MSEPAATNCSTANYRVGMLLAVVAAFALRAYDLQGQSLSSDEIIEVSIARLPWQETVVYPDGFPPLYHLLLSGWVKLFPTPESGRWLSVILGVAAVYAVGRWARQSVSPKAGLFAAVLVAVSPLHVYLSQEMRAYSLYICCASFAMMFFFAALKSDRPTSWLGFVVSAAFAVNTHYYAALLAALLGLLLIVYRPRWREMRRGIAAFVALGACSAPAILLLPGDMSYQSEGFAAKAPLLATLGHTAYAVFAGFTLGPSLTELHVLPMRQAAAMAAPWVVVFALIGSWLLWHGWQELHRRQYGLGIVFLAVASAPTIAVAGALAGVGPKVRYWAWILMPLLVWLAAGAARGWSGRGRWVTRAALAALIGVQLLAIGNSRLNSRYAIEDIRSAAAFLEQHVGSDEPLMVVSDYMAPPLRYYLNGERTLDGWLPHLQPEPSPPANASVGSQPPLKWLIHPRGEAEVRGSAPLNDAALDEWLDSVRTLAPDDGRFWLIYSRSFHGDPEGTLLAFLLDNGWVVFDREFAGVKLYRGQVPR